MNDESSARPIGSGELSRPCHACAFFEGPDEEYRVLLPFARICADCGGRCLHFADPARRAPPPSLPAHGIEVRTWDDTYLRGGSFDPDDMLALIAEYLRDRTPGPASIWADMEWASRPGPGNERLVEYEIRVNEVVQAADAVVVCIYPVGRFSPQIVLEVLRAHPFIVVNGRFEHNPLYTSGGSTSHP